MKRIKIHLVISLFAYGLLGYGLGMFTSGEGDTTSLIVFITILVIYMVVVLTSLEIVKKFLSDK